jgi:hypothetical protein
LLHNRLGQQRNHFTTVGMDEGRTHHLVAIGNRAVSGMGCSTRFTVKLLGRKIARAIEG